MGEMHEFGIMPEAPLNGKRYDSYEPEKYNCNVYVHDDCFYDSTVMSDIDSIDMFWHTIDVRGKGLARCGVTLVPPESMDRFYDAVKHRDEFRELAELILKAKNEHKYIIHFGI